MCLGVERCSWAKELEPLFRAVVHEQGGKRNVGAAPRGSLERGDQRLLDKFKKSK